MEDIDKRWKPELYIDTGGVLKYIFRNSSCALRGIVFWNLVWDNLNKNFHYLVDATPVQIIYCLSWQFQLYMWTSTRLYGEIQNVPNFNVINQ